MSNSTSEVEKALLKITHAVTDAGKRHGASRSLPSPDAPDNPPAGGGLLTGISAPCIEVSLRACGETMRKDSDFGKNIRPGVDTDPTILWLKYGHSRAHRTHRKPDPQ
jgi:hypothetical protein